MKILLLIFLSFFLSLQADLLTSDLFPYKLTYDSFDWPSMKHETNNSRENFYLMSNTADQPFAFAFISAKFTDSKNLDDCVKNLFDEKSYPGAAVNILHQEKRIINGLEFMYMDLHISRFSTEIKGQSYIYLGDNYCLEIDTFALSSDYDQFEYQLNNLIFGIDLKSEAEMSN